MNLLLRTQTGEETMEADDPQLVYIIASWSRICKILGPEFAPYLPYGSYLFPTFEVESFDSQIIKRLIEFLLFLPTSTQ